MRAFKKSGINWIEEIPSTWHVGRLKGLCSFGKGLPITKEDLTDIGTPVISYGQIHSKTNSGVRLQQDLMRFVSEKYLTTNSSSLVHFGDFIFADTSEDYDGCGNCVYVDDEQILFAGYHTIIFRSKTKKDNRFFAYLFKTDAWRSQIRSKVSGVKLFSISRKILADASVLIPPYEEQQKIVYILDAECSQIDKAINHTRESIIQYKKLRQAVISQAVTKGIRRERPMKDSGIAWAQQIPIEWNGITPKAMFAQRKDKATKGERQLTASQQHGVIYQDEYMALTGSKVVTVEKDFDILKHVEAGDFVISMRSFQGGLEYSTKTGSISSAYVMLIPNHEKVEPRFFRWLFKSSVYINALQSTSNMVRDGQAMRYSNFAQVRLYTVPLDEQREIADYLDQKCAEIDDLIAKKEQFLVELENYKKALIYEYVTGKKEVPAEQPTTMSIIYPYFPAALNTDKRRFAQAILMCRILDKCRKKMGRVKLEKMLYTIESSIGFDLETEYVREAAGPLDASIYECERIISKRNKWYTLKSSSYGVSYAPTKDSGKYEKYYDKYFASYDAEIDRIINIFMNYDADQAEIVATLFAAWNDFIIDQRQFSDEDLVDEVLNNWNDSKKRFSRDVWLRAIDQMRKNNIIPSGYGKRTVVKN